MLVKEIPVHLKKGGYFITSGIINLKEEAVRAAFAASEELEVVEITYQGEWLSVTCLLYTSRLRLKWNRGSVSL